MTRAGLSVAVLARNEARNLGRCLPALAFSDDVVVVDDRSTDRTAEVAAAHGARVVRHEMTSFAAQRNWVLTSAALKYPWVLHLDADEVVTPALARELMTRVPASSSGVVGYYLARKTMLGETWLRFSATYPVYVPRVTRREMIRFEAVGHGERFAKTDGVFGYLKEPCLHYNFSKGWADWFDRHNRYSSAEADRIIADPAGGRLRACFDRDPVRRRAALRRWSYRLPCRASLRFLYVYLLRLGCLDGRAGLTYAVLQSIYESMITLKVRERRQG